MSSHYLTTRRTKHGPRYVVRYRLGGRSYPVMHAGSFKTQREARERRNLVAGELAAGRNPADLLRSMLEPSDVARRNTFAEVAAEYEASRVDVAASTARSLS